MGKLNYTSLNAAEKIAKEHDFKHKFEFQNDWYGVEIPVYTPDDYQGFIQEVIEGESSFIHSESPDVDYYYDEGKNGLVIVNMLAQNGGTCYRPYFKQEHFLEKVRSNLQQKGITKENTDKLTLDQIPKGGYEKLNAIKAQMQEQNTTFEKIVYPELITEKELEQAEIAEEIEAIDELEVEFDSSEEISGQEEIDTLDNLEVEAINELEVEFDSSEEISGQEEIDTLDDLEVEAIDESDVKFNSSEEISGQEEIDTLDDLEVEAIDELDSIEIDGADLEATGSTSLGSDLADGKEPDIDM